MKRSAVSRFAPGFQNCDERGNKGAVPYYLLEEQDRHEEEPG